MVMNAAQDPRNFTLDAPLLRHAERILSWLEHYLPAALEELSTSAVGDDQLRLLKQLRQAKGEIGHSDWLRLNASRMNSENFRRGLDTLRQAKLVAFDSSKRRYYLLPAGKAVDV